MPEDDDRSTSLFGALEAWPKQLKVDNYAKKHLESQRKMSEKEKASDRLQIGFKITSLARVSC